MDEIIERYAAARKWIKEMIAVMIVMLCVMCGMIVWGLLMPELALPLIAFGAVIGIGGVSFFLIARHMFSQTEKLLAEYFAAAKFSEEEIRKKCGEIKMNKTVLEKILRGRKQ